MSNQVIMIGIDLGTANSKLAVNLNGKIEIIKKPGGVEYTPSVFGFDKSGNRVVGQKAYEALYKSNVKGDAENYVAEIKRLMGTSEMISFSRGKVKMAPEEISAEILMNLKEDLVRKYPDFDTDSAVITVPAAFTTLKCEATKKAGDLAGFKHVVLLQEPIAAAISYGFMNAKNENWLIYDFGGGTFDLALISCRDGVLSVLGHGGDDFLGGKDIDWNIVNKVIVPKIKEKYNFADFNRSNPKYAHVFARLKYFAESSKIELSEYAKTTIEIEEIGKDGSGKEVYLSIPFSRNEFNELIKSKIDRTIELVKKTIAETGLSKNSIKRIILVGGTTLIPYIKERLEKDLDITVDSSVDPLTVVAHGACIFAMGQKVPDELQEKNTKKEKKGAHDIELHYEALTSNTEEAVTGSISDLEDSGEYYVQIQSDSGTFTGQKIKVNKGRFYYTVKLNKNRQNKYWVYLFDGKSNTIEISKGQDSFTITHGLSFAGAPLPNSIQVVIAKRDVVRNQMVNVCDLIFKKGDVLPLKKPLDVYKTARKLSKGENNPLDIRIVEGESEIPDRNRLICEIGILGKDLPYDLPAGTPIELTVEMNESREGTVKWYIPLIDMSGSARMTFKDEELSASKMSEELDTQKRRAVSVSESSSPEDRKKIAEEIQSISEGIANANVDEDEKRKANKNLKDLKMHLDEIEEDKRMPQLVKEYNARVEDLQKIINEYADPKQKDENNEQLDLIKQEAEDAIKRGDKTSLIGANQNLDSLRIKAIYSNPQTWVTVFRQIAASGNFTDEKEAQYLINKGNRAISSGDYEELKRCTTDLNLLRPVAERAINLSGITR